MSQLDGLKNLKLIGILLKLFAIVLSTLTILGFSYAYQGTSSVAVADTINDIPMPKLEKPVYILGPAGELFSFATCNRGDLGFTIGASTIPPGQGPIPHIHHHTNEWFWTPKGGIELFHSERRFPLISFPATSDSAGRTKVYLIPTQPNGIVHGPKFYVHGFTNQTSETLPLTFIWAEDKDSPEYPLHDGGIREYFDEVGIKVDDLNNLPPITDEARRAFVTQATKYGINQSDYFLKYVNEISTEIPDSIANLRDDKTLNEILNAIKEFNSGSTEVTCQ
jgi:hypothetical protein